MKRNDLNDLYADQALAYIRKHEGEHLCSSQLVTNAAEFLQTQYQLSSESAEKIALRSLCEHESRRTSLYIDMDSSTSSMLVISDTRRNVRRVIPVSAIANLLGTAALAPVRTRSYIDAMSGKSLPNSDHLTFDQYSNNYLAPQN